MHRQVRLGDPPPALEPRRHSRLETLERRVYGNGWAARMAQRLGLQRLRVQILEHDLSIRGWPADAPPLRIAFASDFHAGPTTPPRLLERACEALVQARPDVLLLGGDYVYLNTRGIEPLARALAAVPAPLGRYAVLGNHDVWHDRPPILRSLQAAGIELLINRSLALPAPYSFVSVVGIDDPWLGQPDLAAAFAGAGPVRVFLTHSPSGLALAGQQRFDLALAGHTHGGQIALPGGRPVHVPRGPLCREYPHGRHAVGPDGASTLIVSRGIGTVQLPVRLFAPADVLAVTLRA